MRFLVFTTFLTSTSFAQYAVVDLKDFEAEQLISKSFSVSSATSVFIDAVGVKYRSEKWNRTSPMFAYGWILNADTREVVWTMNPDNVSRSWGTVNIEFKGTLSLKPGNYEAYYSTYGHRVVKISSPSYFGEFVKNLVKVFVDDGDLYEDSDQWKFRILAKEEDKKNFGTALASGRRSICSLVGPRNDDYLERGFTLDRDMRVRIYCNGEGADDKMYDYGWITHDKTGKQIWQMEFASTVHGGGAMKNRTYSGILTLPAGNYVATYITDDSHSPNDWNMAPPFDPSYWGLTVFAVDDKDVTYVHEYRKAQKTEILNLTRIGDSRYESKGITLKKAMTLHIVALGEGRDEKMYDHGWITEVKSGRRVWEMKYSETRYAGGAQKNRLFEGSVSLPAGDYRVHYVTDGSHSYGDWNSDPPFKPSSWGIALSLIDNSELAYVEMYTEKEDASELARLVRVGDHAYKSKAFRMTRAGNVRVQCIGEGSDGDMYDYGWIKNAQTGRTVWEMTYRMTDYAGGAKKNRIFDDAVYLEAGDYVVYYVTDGSHSFEEWNSDPPSSPELWGITVRLTP